MTRSKTVVVIDSGGRGAALVYKYSQSPHVKQIIAIPGNDLMAINSAVPVKIFPDLKTTSIRQIISVCKKFKSDLIDVAQDDAVEAGLVDKLIEQGFNVIGPTKLAGQIEWDKAWARDFTKRHNLPIPKYIICKSQADGIKFVKKYPNKKWFVKAAGLASGKGVIPAENVIQATEAIKNMSDFGLAGQTFVIEEALVGEEFSMFAICDGKSFQIIGTAQDHKRLYNGDLGPNTGGMGCVSSPKVINSIIYKQAKNIINNTIKALSTEGREYKGILYLGAMVVGKKVFIIEFNARWGDPEGQILIPAIKNDLYELSLSVVNSTLSKTKIKTDSKSRIVVVGSLRENLPIKERQLFGLNKLLKLPGILFFGTRVKIKGYKHFVTSGRLFHVVAEGKNIIEARKRVYDALSILYIEDNALHFRTDIGWRDVARLNR